MRNKTEIIQVNILIILLLHSEIKTTDKMLIINVKEEENIDRALKRYKRKVNSTRIIKELRNRKHFEKPSVVRRTEVLNAAYRTEKFGNA